MQSTELATLSRPRLLIIVNVYTPDLGGGILFSDLCTGLAARGFDVEVRCAVSYYPEWTDKANQNGWRIHRYTANGVDVTRHGLFIPSNPSSLVQRLFYEGSFFLSLARRWPKKHRYDMVMVYCPLVGAVAYGGLARWRTGCPLWLNVQDLSADAAAASGISSGKATRVLAWVQNSLFNRADVWSSISPVMVKRLEELRTRNQPVLYLPNWLHASLRTHIAQQSDKLGRNPSEPLRLFYSGNIGTKQDLLTFCKALHTTDLAFSFRIHGGGGQAQPVGDWVATTGDTRFSFYPLTDEAELARQLHATDFFVITEKAGSGGSFIPSKLIPGVSSQTPILAVCDADSPLGREMETAGIGPRSDWHTLDALFDSLSNVYNNSESYTRWQQRATERARFYEREVLIDRYADAIRAVIANDHEGLKRHLLANLTA